MSSDEISLNGLNTQLVFQDEALRSFNCHQHQQQQQQHRVGDPGPKTRELTGFVDEKIFSVDRDRYFRAQPSIFAEHHDRRDPPPQQARDWSGNATSPSTDESDGEDDDDGVDDDDDDEDDDVDEAHKSNNHNVNCDSTNCNNNNNKNNTTNPSMVTAVVDKMGNGKAKNQPIFGKNGDAMQNVNNGAIVTVAAEADADVYYSSQYLQQGTEGSSGSGQKECVVVDHGCGISGSGDSIRALLSDPVSGAFMDDAMILPCGHSFGAAGVQHVIRMKVCYTCSRPVSEESLSPNLALRAAVQAFRREEELQFYRSCKRKRERYDQEKGSYGDSTMDPPRGRGVQFPFAVTDRVIIKGNKRTPQRFVGREAIVTTQCLNGWYVVKTLDNAESVKLQYRSLAKVSDDSSSKPTSSKMQPNWL